MIRAPRWHGLLALAVIAGHTLAAGPARADSDSVSDSDSGSDPVSVSDSDSGSDGRRGSYGAVTVGWMVGLTGPLGFGLVAEAEVFPGGPLDRYGLGVYYRSDPSGDQGMVTGGVVYEAGATRPRYVLSLHADVGATHGPAHPVLGAGVRSQLTIWNPLTIAGNTTAHFIIDGTDSRLALAVTFTAGIAR